MNVASDGSQESQRTFVCSRDDAFDSSHAAMLMGAASQALTSRLLSDMKASAMRDAEGPFIASGHGFVDLMREKNERALPRPNRPEFIAIGNSRRPAWVSERLVGQSGGP